MTNSSYIVGIINQVQNILDLLIPLLIAAALIAFFWGLVKYVWSGGGENHEEGKKVMIAGIVALFVMVSVWGIIRLAQGALGVSSGSGGINAPTVPR